MKPFWTLIFDNINLDLVFIFFFQLPKITFLSFDYYLLIYDYPWNSILTLLSTLYGVYISYYYIYLHYFSNNNANFYSYIISYTTFYSHFTLYTYNCLNYCIVDNTVSYEYHNRCCTYTIVYISHLHLSNLTEYLLWNFWAILVSLFWFGLKN